MKIYYKNENGNLIERQYATIMDFIDEMDSDRVDIPMLDYEVTGYSFFENPADRGTFPYIRDILAYCREITR